MKMLTPRQKAVLDFIKEFIATRGYAPSYREISEHFGFSSLGSVHKYINALKNKGVLQNEKAHSRSLVVTEEGQPVQSQGLVKVTFMGYLSANMGLETPTQTHVLELPKVVVPSPENSYALRAKGNFLVDEQIRDGDLLVIETEQHPNAGDLALIKTATGEITLKNYYPEGQYARLEGSQGLVKTITVRRDELTVYGILVGLLRVY